MADKEVTKLLREARRQGWRVEKRRKHYQLYSPDGRGIVNVPTTPSSRRTIMNRITRMRHYGFEWKGR